MLGLGVVSDENELLARGNEVARSPPCRLAVAAGRDSTFEVEEKREDVSVRDRSAPGQKQE